MAYRIDEFGNIVREYITDEGDMGIEVTSTSALAARMALLGIDDPGLALAALSAESQLVRGQDPFSCVFEAIAAVPAMHAPVAPEPVAPSPAGARMMRTLSVQRTEELVPELPVVVEVPPPIPMTAEALLAEPPVMEAQAQARGMLPVALGPDPVEVAQFKEGPLFDLNAELQALRTEFLTGLIPSRDPGAR